MLKISYQDTVHNLFWIQTETVSDPTCLFLATFEFMIKLSGCSYAFNVAESIQNEPITVQAMSSTKFVTVTDISWIRIWKNKERIRDIVCKQHIKYQSKDLIQLIQLH